MQLRRVHLGSRRRVLRSIDIAQVQHTAEDIIAPRCGSLWIIDRVDARRRLGQCRDHGHLRQRQLVNAKPVIDPCCSLYTVGTIPQVDLVEVQLENFILAERPLDAKCQQDLRQLAQVGLLAGKKEITRHLHGDGACATSLFTGTRQFNGSSHQPREVHAGVFIEMIVLGSQEGLHHQRRDRFDSDRRTTLVTEFCQQPAIMRVNAQRLLQLHILQPGNGG